MNEIIITEPVNISEIAVGDTCTVSVEFREYYHDDFLQNLSIELIKETDGWKVRSYGLEKL